MVFKIKGFTKILGNILLLENNMQKVYGALIWVRKGKRENGLTRRQVDLGEERKGKRENGPTRRDWPPRGFRKFKSTSNSNEF
jgi:hypothetical protein